MSAWLSVIFQLLMLEIFKKKKTEKVPLHQALHNLQCGKQQGQIQKQSAAEAEQNPWRLPAQQKTTWTETEINCTLPDLTGRQFESRHDGWPHACISALPVKPQTPANIDFDTDLRIKPRRRANKIQINTSDLVNNKAPSVTDWRSSPILSAVWQVKNTFTFSYSDKSLHL